MVLFSMQNPKLLHIYYDDIRYKKDIPSRIGLFDENGRITSSKEGELTSIIDQPNKFVEDSQS